MKKLCVISCPIDCYSGYSARSRDLVKAFKAILDINEWELKIAPQRWGSTPWGFIEDHKEKWGWLREHILTNPQLPKQPELFIQISVPNEFNPIGKYNIGVTAGIETTICDASWIQGINRMDLTLVSSEHAKSVFINTVYETRDSRTNQTTGNSLKVEKLIEVLFEGADLSIYIPKESKDFNLDYIPEDFLFLTSGHWMQGHLGEDRKNIGLTIKAFYETFKNKKKKPALLLKISGGVSSYSDRNDILSKINQIKETVNSKDIPNIYLLHGELSDEDMNNVYNHPKVKAMVSLTKGEGFGRPLLEFSLSKKPIIAPNWSGQIDFLNSEFTTLIPGTLRKIHPSAVVPNVLLAESEWFNVDLGHVGHYMRDIFENYKPYKERAVRQAYFSKTNFSWEGMKNKLKTILDKSLPEFPKEIALKLPQLRKIELPKLIKQE